MQSDYLLRGTAEIRPRLLLVLTFKLRKQLAKNMRDQARHTSRQAQTCVFRPLARRRSAMASTSSTGSKAMRSLPPSFGAGNMLLSGLLKEIASLSLGVYHSLQEITNDYARISKIASPRMGLSVDRVRWSWSYGEIWLEPLCKKQIPRPQVSDEP